VVGGLENDDTIVGIYIKGRKYFLLKEKKEKREVNARK
jgi:hypothetical protein